MSQATTSVSDAMIMLMERVENLEWCMQHLLGRDVVISNGVKTSYVLCRGTGTVLQGAVLQSAVLQGHTSQPSGKHYMIQLVLPEIPHQLLLNATAVATLMDKKPLVANIEDIARNNIGNRFARKELNNSVHNFIMDVFQRAQPMFPMCHVHDFTLTTHSDKEFVATWIVQYAECVQIDEVTSCIKTCMSTHCLDPFSVIVYPVSEQVFKDEITMLFDVIKNNPNAFVIGNGIPMIPYLLSGLFGMPSNTAPGMPGMQNNSTISPERKALIEKCERFTSASSCPQLIRYCVDHLRSNDDFSKNIASLMDQVRTMMPYE